MKKLNQKGFTAFEIILLIIIVAVIGLIGWYTYNQSKKTETVETPKPTAQETVGENNSPPEGWVTFEKDGVKFYHPNTWKNNPDIKAPTVAEFDIENTNMDVTIYKTKPVIYYSSNAPFFCRLEENKWKHYSYDFDTSTQPATSTEKPMEGDSCDKITKETINGNTVYSTSGGALGQFKYISAVEVKTGYAVFSGYKNYDPDIDNASNPELQKVVDEVKNSVKATVKEFTEVN